MAAQPKKLADYAGLLLLVAVAALVLWRLRPGAGAGGSAIPDGTPLPTIDAVGWVNLAEGDAFDPAGELVVVDCWATWCGPCRRDAPQMAKIVARYRPLGIKFVGVTQETADDLPKIEQFIASVPGFDWPVAYGAFKFMNTLPLQGIPTVILFGRDGRARWSGFGSYGLEAALDEALAADRPA